MPNGRSRALSLFEDPGPVYRLREVGPEHFGAFVIAALAYPEAKYLDLRMETAMRLSGLRLIRSNPDLERWALIPGGASVPVDIRKLYGGLRRLESRLQRRFDFGRLVLQAVRAVETGERPLSAWGNRWNRAEAIRKTLSPTGDQDIPNFDRKYWRPALAIAHLAAGWLAVTHAEGMIGASRDYDRLMNDAPFLLKVLREAERLEPLIEASDLKIPTSILIKFRV